MKKCFYGLFAFLASLNLISSSYAIASEKQDQQPVSVSDVSEDDELAIVTEDDTNEEEQE